MAGQASARISATGRPGGWNFHLLYNAGRIATYTLIGALVGWLGSALAYTDKFREVTRILQEVRVDAPEAAERLLPLVYEELRQLAGTGGDRRCARRPGRIAGQQVAHHSRTITMSDPAELRALIEAEQPDLVVPEIEAIATPVLEALTGVVEKQIKKGGEVPLKGLGKFKVVKRKARMGRNPATGEAIKIKAKKVVKFRVAKAAKDAILGA